MEEVEGIDEFTTIVADNTSFTTIELYDDYNRAQTEEPPKPTCARPWRRSPSSPAEMEDEPVLKQFNPARMTVLEIALGRPGRDRLIANAPGRGRGALGTPAVHRQRPPGWACRTRKCACWSIRCAPREHGITLTDVIAAVRNRNVSSTGGMLESPDERRQVVMWSRFDEPDRGGGGDPAL